jgi:class 3 adenylate cyclase
MTPATEQLKLAAIMFTDMAGYSALAQRNQALALELLEEHRRVARGGSRHPDGKLFVMKPDVS